MRWGPKAQNISIYFRKGVNVAKITELKKSHIGYKELDETSFLNVTEIVEQSKLGHLLNKN